MKRILAASILMLSCVGCHAPVPKLNPFAYGQTCVPPPGTNSVNAPNSYYTAPVQPGVAPAPGTGFRQVPLNNRWSNLESQQADTLAANSSPVGTGVTTTTANVVDPQDIDVALAKGGIGNSVAPANFLAANPLGLQTSPSAATVTNANSRVRGMVVNDLTNLSEPQPFTPAGRVLEISQLPNPPVTSPSPATTPAIIAASPTQSTSPATTLEGWRTR